MGRKNYTTISDLHFDSESTLLKMTENDGPTFCRRMRDATKAIHDTSDKLVNLKLGLSMSNDMVWANGLLVFAKVFFQLEKSLDEYPALADLDVEGMRRSEALEEDLDHFFGESWRTKEEPEALVKYIDHLKHIAEEDEPLLLVAYIYHLYMGLLSGGQILSKKRQFFGSDDGKVKGTAVTTFEGETPGGLKKKLRAAANALGQELDADLQERIIQEGSKVFKLNNSIIYTIEGVDEIFYKKIFTWLAILALVIGIIPALYMKL